MQYRSGTGSAHRPRDPHRAHRLGERRVRRAPLAHRCLSKADFTYNSILESVLDRPRETTLISQDGSGGDLGMVYLVVIRCATRRWPSVSSS